MESSGIVRAKVLIYVFSVAGFVHPPAVAQVNQQYVSTVWTADMRDGSYRNPVLYADYSDPDVCRVGDDYYLVASSFDAVPGLPLLHSNDLVNWCVIGHALSRQVPIEHFKSIRHGNGVWAPSIRYHNNEFYIYYPDPDFGIYVIKARNPQGPWSVPDLVEAGKGLIDPCPLWDDDGNVYLVHAYAGSRAGIKSILVVKKLTDDGTRTMDQGVIVYDGHGIDPTVEGPKFYKRNGYYYILAPAGGVSTGWQLALRSRNVYGPYERRVVMDQGSTEVNGPHQGAWVDTVTGEDWFLHFQDRGAYGRVVHLQPMKWVDDWPVIGVDRDGDGKGEPVKEWKKPDVKKTYPVETPLESDEFNGGKPGMQWQWQANPEATWLMAQNHGMLRLYAEQLPDSARNLWDVPNLLMQKMPGEEFVVTTRLTFKPNPLMENERTGLVVMGRSYAGLMFRSRKDGIDLLYSVCHGADKGNTPAEQIIASVADGDIFLRVVVKQGARCFFSYSIDGEKFKNVPGAFEAQSGRWIGAKIGIFCTRTTQTNDSGFADFDWFRVEGTK